MWAPMGVIMARANGKAADKAASSELSLVSVHANPAQPRAALRRRRRSASGQAAECVIFQTFRKVVARPDGLAPRLRLVRPSWRRERWAYPAPPSAPWPATGF